LPDGQGIQTLVYNQVTGYLYGMTTPSPSLFVFDIQKMKVISALKIESSSPCKALICDAQGRIFGSATMGWLFCYDPLNDKLELLDVRLPSEKGREYLTTISATATALDGTIYGGTYGDGMLFKLDPSIPTIKYLGKPTYRNEIQALAATLDGRLFGISNESGNIGRLFEYDPVHAHLRDLGLIECGGVPKFWPGHQFGAMTTGRNGEIYIGESDRISHLFIYYPSIRA
jgi:hypothetical protein